MIFTWGNAYDDWMLLHAASRAGISMPVTVTCVMFLASLSLSLASSSVRSKEI